ncbi:hypothetical protein TKK_0007317 [Trichogramma kaykai]
MRFRLVTVVALLAIASTGEGRPSEPGSATLDSGYARIAQAPIAVGSLDSRYISRRKTSMSSGWRRNNSINTTNNPSQSSRWHGHTVFPRLRFESESKRQYLPLGAMSSVKSTGSIPIKNQSNGRSNNHNPLSIPAARSNKAMIKSAPRLQKSSDNSNPSHSFSTFPIPVSLPRKINTAKEAEDRFDKQFITYNDMIPRSLPSSINRKNYVNFQSVPTRVDKIVVSNRTSTPKPIPVTISHNTVTSNVPSRNQRKMLASRTLVRLVPTLLKTGPNSRRNSTTFKSKLPSEEIYANSWPNEALQNVHDLLNYEKYTSFEEDIDNDKNHLFNDKLAELNVKQTTTIPPDTTTIQAQSIETPIVSSTSEDNSIDVDSKIQIDNLLEDLGKSRHPNIQTSSEIKQNTVIQILNPIKKNPNNMTFAIPMKFIKESYNKTKTEVNKPQKVNIMFFENKSNQTTQQQTLPSDLLGIVDDCPTIMINSLTQINNTIESKEGCSDLNIVINSHVLNTNIVKPGSGGQSAQKDPNSVSSSDSTTATYPSTYQSSYQTGPTSYPSQGQINDYYSTDKNPGGQALSDRPVGSESNSNSPIISTLELFQNTQINIGGNKPSQSIGEAQDEALSEGLDSAGTNADGSPLTDPNEATNDITGTAPANNAGGATNIPTATAASADAASGMFTAPDTAANDVGTAESLNSGTSGLSLPSIPNLPSLPNLPNLPGGSGNLLGGSGGSQSELTALAGGGGDDEDDFEEEILDALSPADLLDSMSSVYSYFSVLNPINYGIFGIAVAPFMAFAAGVVGVAAFLFPWAFPSSFDIARSWRGGGNVNSNIGFDFGLRNIVQSSILKQKQSRELKDIQSMDQSLRTVATQLLNSTSTREEIISMPDDKIETMDTPIQVVHVSTLLSDASPESHNDGKESPTRMKFGIPVNSKFGHFEVTNPGHAMAMTEEEIEREMATATPPPKTTTGMLSTWIHLYPQSTATEEKVVTEIKAGSDSDSYVTSTTTKLLQNTVKLTTTTAKPKKTETSATTLSHKSTEPVTTTTKVTKFTGSTFKMSSTTPASVTTEEKFTDAGFTDTTQEQLTTQEPATTKTAPSSTTKKPKNNATQKVKNSSKNPGNKPQKSGTNRVKVTPTRRPSLHKNESVTSTSRIEKVTLRPTTLSLNRNESTDKPHFVTKIKASLMTDGQKTTPATPALTSFTPTNVKPHSSILLKSNFTNAEKNENKIPSPTQVNNFMKVQVKKPIISDTTKIEIQPIQVNPPVLTIEKIGEANSEKKDKIQQVTDSPSSVVKVTSNVELAASERPSSPTTITAAIPSTTTKKPRGTNKRKKNKNRRRKQSTTSTTTAATPTDSSDEEDATFDTLVTNALELAGIQESKIEPESKIPPKKKKTTPNTQVQKPFGTQIYNFLSREVMPSVGVMSLVGLGLGLASYFLYPFGSVISRRNYEVEPNYKYNLDEYGGNYGLSEEEVLSKVYSGMTPNQHNDKKYPTTSEKSQNYYRYSGIETTTRYPSVTKSANRVIYRPVETTAYDVNYRNNEFKYPDVQTTPNYYERQRQNSEAEFVPAMSKMTVGNNRQFVVGNIPKEYESEKVSELFSSNDKLNHNLQFATEKSFSSDNMPSSATTAEPLGNPAALISQSREDPSRLLYDDMEISPDAVAIEHGPRSLRVKRSMSADTDSVIQMIPTKSEIAKEKQEEEQEKDLSNEILDIIDEALPGNKDHPMKKYDKKEPTKMTTVNHEQHTKNNVPHLDENNKSSTSSSISVPNTSTHKSEAVMTSTQGPNVSIDIKKDSTEAVDSLNTKTTTTTKNIDLFDSNDTSFDWDDIKDTSTKPSVIENFSIFDFAKKIIETKVRLTLTVLKHASEGFAKYLGQVRKNYDHGK